MAKPYTKEEIEAGSKAALEIASMGAVKEVFGAFDEQIQLIAVLTHAYCASARMMKAARRKAGLVPSDQMIVKHAFEITREAFEKAAR